MCLCCVWWNLIKKNVTIWEIAGWKEICARDHKCTRVKYFWCKSEERKISCLMIKGRRFLPFCYTKKKTSKWRRSFTPYYCKTRRSSWCTIIAIATTSYMYLRVHFQATSSSSAVASLVHHYVLFIYIGTYISLCNPYDIVYITS